jgi:glyoxylase I family protein
LLVEHARVMELPMGIKVEGFAPLIQVFDMPRSVAFYRDILGFEVVTTSPPRGRDDFDWGLLRLDGVELMLNTAYETDDRPHTPDASRMAAHRDTAFFFGCRDVDAAYEYLRAKGLDLEPPSIAPYGMKQLYLKDPDGYEICLQWRAAAEAPSVDADARKQ